MAANSSLPLIYYTVHLVAIITTLAAMLSSPVSALRSVPHAPDYTRGVLFEEKSRLGSTPPSCYNKCNQCHPCTAVQVPTSPTLTRVQPPQASVKEPSSAAIFEYDSYSGDNNRYSNYKPLGWKCRCKDHFYNP